MIKYKLNTLLTLPINVTYELLPEQEGFPVQADVTKVYIEVAGRGDRTHKVQLLKTLSEEEILQIEDEILENL